MRRVLPPADQVRDALERILTSDVFARSERARDLLRYLVEQDLAGKADRLKAFAIAVDVYGRGESFDPTTDTLVRVQAGRLRDLMDAYYDGTGASETLRISIPRGSYVPDYQPQQVDVPARVADVAESEQPSVPDPDVSVQSYVTTRTNMLVPTRIAFAMLGALVVAAALVGYLINPGHDDVAVLPTTVATANAEPTADNIIGIAAGAGQLPQVFLKVEVDHEDSQRLVATLRRGLGMFDTVQFLARAPETPGKDAFEIVIERGLNERELHIELQDITSGKVLMNRDLQVRDMSQEALNDVIADMLTTIAPVSGVIHASIVERGAASLMTRCLFLNEEFYRDQKAEAHREAYECFEQLLALQVKSPLVYSELAGLHVHAIAGRYSYPPDASTKRAQDYARQAVQMGPGSPYAHRAMGYVLSRTATREESLRWIRKAYELNTFDLGVAASLGYALIFDEEYAEGTAILDRAVTAASAHPTWWDYGLFLGRLMINDYPGAENAVGAIAASKRAHYIAARLVAAHLNGDEAGSKELLNELVTNHSRFVSDPEAFFQRGNYPASLTTKLMDALREAGLTSAS